MWMVTPAASSAERAPARPGRESPTLSAKWCKAAPADGADVRRRRCRSRGTPSWRNAFFAVRAHADVGASGCDAEGVRTHRLRRSRFVEDVDLRDRETAVGEEVGDRSGEVAAAEDALLH